MGLRGRELEAYLYDDHHTLAGLGGARGVALDGLVDRLLARWGDVPQRGVLRERTVRVLTQGHLAQHLFFHVFHGLDLHPHSEHLFGMPADAYRALREGGASYADVAHEGGVPLSTLRAHVVSAVVSDRRDGVARGEAWPAEAARIGARTLARLGCWLRQPPAALDRANPYGRIASCTGRTRRAGRARLGSDGRTSAGSSGSGAGWSGPVGRIHHVGADRRGSSMSLKRMVWVGVTVVAACAVPANAQDRHPRRRRRCGTTRRRSTRT